MHEDLKEPVLRPHRFLDRTYSDRQLIYVGDDALVVAADTKEEPREVGAPEADPPQPKRKRVFRAALNVLSSLAPAGALERLATRRALRAHDKTAPWPSFGSRAWYQWSRLHATNQGLHLNLLSRSEAAALGLQFEPGHPREGQVYAANPVLPRVYYTLLSFHRATFEQKFNEALLLLASLGATRIEAEHEVGWDKKQLARLKLSLPISERLVSVGPELDINSGSTMRVMFEGTLRGRDTPEVPETLAWYMHEPAWQSVAKMRMEFGMTAFNLQVSYKDDYGINTKLTAAVASLGFEVGLGHEFTTHVQTVWKLQGSFSESRPMHHRPT
jgi:hypothetical protein